jgi:pimeloyl-ACP methyl ester carboxylesterase
MVEESGILPVAGAGIAWRRVRGSGPTVVFLGGFASAMAGIKASALATWAECGGADFLRFDYFGHGVSEGAFRDGTVSRWRGDALAVIDGLTSGSLVLVGSSMGGWIACLAAMVRPERVKGLVLIAPAADFTEALIRPGLPAQALAQIESEGAWTRPSQYDAAGYPITRALLDDGARWTILPGPVPIEAPVRILQGEADPDVPWRHALELSQALKSRDVIFTLIKDGDHRLARPQDVARLTAAVEELRQGAS